MRGFYFNFLLNMHAIKSTYKVLGKRALQLDSAEEWIDWALEMMTNGIESDHLIILAGTSPTINRFQLDEIVNAALKELSLNKTGPEENINGYIYFLIAEATDNNLPYKNALRELRNLCMKNDYDPKLMPFYLLSFAYEDLEEFKVQFYWDGADRENIDSIIKSEFQRWQNEYISRTDQNT
jgi:hypothetical protein